MKPTVEFDQTGSEYAANWQEIDSNLREQGRVVWTEAHGGYWIVTRYAECQAVLKDWRTFSSENDISGTGNGGQGILIPRNEFQFALSESDPPQASHLRNFEIPFFLAKEVVKWEAEARRYAHEAIDAIAPSGKIDLAHDFCVPVPAKTVMGFAGIPLDRWEVFALSAQDMTRLQRDHPDYPHDQIVLVQQLLGELVQLRRKEPLNDIVSVLCHGEMNGKPLSDEMIIGTLSAVVFGGFDTTTTATLNTLLFLDDKPELREAVRTDPKVKSALIEEILRLHPPGHGVARTATVDVELGGQQIKAGERVYLLFSSANRDPAKFERPDEFWLERPNATQHLTFSFGQHRCLGSMLAKMEMATMLDVIFERIGDYQIDRSAIVRNPSIGSIDGFVSMPAHFGPAREIAAAA